MSQKFFKNVPKGRVTLSVLNLGSSILFVERLNYHCFLNRPLDKSKTEYSEGTIWSLKPCWCTRYFSKISSLVYYHRISGLLETTICVTTLVCNYFYCSSNSVPRMKNRFYVKKVFNVWCFQGNRVKTADLSIFGKQLAEPPGQEETPPVTAPHRPDNHWFSHAPTGAAIKPQYVQDRNATGRLHIYDSFLYTTIANTGSTRIFFKMKDMEQNKSKKCNWNASCPSMSNMLITAHPHGKKK